MNKSEVVKLLNDLHIENLEDFESTVKDKFELISTFLSVTFEHISEQIPFVTGFYDYNEITYEWKYTCLSFYILKLLDYVLIEEHLSVKEEKEVKARIQSLLNVTVLKNINPTLPFYTPIETTNKDEILHKYNILKCSVKGFLSYMKRPNLRLLILPHCLRRILVAVIQIAHCPLMKPSEKSFGTFVMTQERYDKFLVEQEEFTLVLESLRRDIHVEIFARELMVVNQSKTPKWFQKTISSILLKVFKSNRGVESLARVMLDEDDSTKTWKGIEVLTKIVIASRSSVDFQSNVCEQVLRLLDVITVEDESMLVYERLVVSCIKALFIEDSILVKSKFLSRVTKTLLRFTSGNEFSDGDITREFKQTLRLLHGCFIQTTNFPCLPIELLKPLVNIIFQFYHISVRDESMCKDLKEILVKYLQASQNEMDNLLDVFIFGFDVAGIHRFRSDINIEMSNGTIIVKRSEHTIIYATTEAAEIILKLLETNQKIVLFGYLLKCISNKDKYFGNSNQELLVSEECMGNMERLLTIHNLLSQLSEDKYVQESLKAQPDTIIEYIKSVLNSNSSEFLFVITMIIESLVNNSHKNSLGKYKVLVEPLVNISRETLDNELRRSCNNIVKLLSEGRKGQAHTSVDMSELDQALEDMTDPLLPVRGHALMVLGKLARKKDKNAMERKQYLLNLFLLSLKDEDTYIYLNAIEGLAALADLFPDTILQVLCDEYAAYDRKNERYETRMKLGEALVRVIKHLGDMALKYKALLLNTFLLTAKDDDPLIRASSLSNLGEVCRILGYKLGTIISEVMVCVHAVIATDKAVEARRAAVTVIRQLFVGLESEMISFLKDDILPIYRTLKEIYLNDKDDVMRLQAQLALEELNENMKNIIFPKPQLYTEKKNIMLN